MKILKQQVLYLAWVQAVLATLGSLYASEIIGLVPCSLCWYQRILMYPLTVILTVAIIKKDRFVHLLVLPFSILGMIAAAYQYLLQKGIIAEISACVSGIPCNTQYINWFGFVTIPLLSFLAFASISLCMVIFARNLDDSRS